MVAARSYTVDPKKLEYGFGVIMLVLLLFYCSGIRGRSCSNFLASTAG